MAARLPSKPPKNLFPEPSLGESERQVPNTSAATGPVLQELGLLIRRTPALKERAAALRTKVLWLQHRVDTLLMSEAERSETNHIWWGELRTQVHEVIIEAYRLVQEIRKTCGKTADDSWKSVVLAPFDDLVLNFGKLSLGDCMADLQGKVRQLDTMLFDLLDGDARVSEEQ